MNTHQFALVGLINDLIDKDSRFGPVRSNRICGCFENVTNLLGVESMKIQRLPTMKTRHRGPLSRTVRDCTADRLVPRDPPASMLSSASTFGQFGTSRAIFHLP